MAKSTLKAVPTGERMNNGDFKKAREQADRVINGMATLSKDFNQAEKTHFYNDVYLRIKRLGY